MKPIDRRIAVKSGLRSVPVKNAKLALAGVPAHINPTEDRLLQRLLPASHGRVLTSGRLAKAGRLGDDRLTLVNPREAKVLKRHGGSGARNPKTGLREFEDDKGDGNPGGGHNADGNAASGGYGGGVGATSDPGSGPSGLGGGFGPGGFFSENEDLSKESEIGGPGAGRRGVGFDPENNPEMGGGRARAAGLASVHALGPAGRDVMSARSVMAGLDPTLADRALDFTGYYAPGGIPGSRMATMAATMAGGLIGGPLGATAANIAHQTTLGGRNLADVAPSAVGGLFGGLGSLAAQAAVDGIRGVQSYEAPMTQNDRARRDAALDAAERNGKTGSTPGAEPGTNDGAGAGTDYVMAPPPAAAVPTAAAAPAAPAPKDNWDEAGFLTRNPEVGKAVKDGIWTSGRSFNTAYKAQAGANYDSAKALGLLSPYTNDMLAARPGVAVAYRG